jgi:hypothetical protein
VAEILQAVKANPMCHFTKALAGRCLQPSSQAYVEQILDRSTLAYVVFNRLSLLFSARKVSDALCPFLEPYDKDQLKFKAADLESQTSSREACMSI